MGHGVFPAVRGLVTAVVVLLTAVAFMTSTAKAQDIQTSLQQAYAQFQADTNNGVNDAADRFAEAIAQIAQANEQTAGGCGPVAAALINAAQNIVPDSTELLNMIGRGLAYYSSDAIGANRPECAEEVARTVNQTGAAREYARAALALGQIVLASIADPLMRIWEVLAAAGSTDDFVLGSPN